jgi:hypothetical protein
MDTTKIYEEIANSTFNFRETVIKTVMNGYRHFYVPSLFDKNAFKSFCLNPDSFVLNTKNLRAFSSISEGAARRYDSEFKYENFFVLDPIIGQVISLVDMKGDELLNVKNESGVYSLAAWYKNQIIFKNSEDQFVCIETAYIIKGISEVKVFHDWSVVDSRGYRVLIKKVTISDNKIVKVIEF